MNDRIRELAHLATDYYSNGYVDCPELNSHRFAQLIIQECIKQAKSVGDLRGANDDMVYGADLAALQIAKHFGVEQ